MSLSNKKFTQTEIGLIPDDWQVTITKKCLSVPITDGPHETPILYEDGIPFISAESVSSGNGRIDFSRMRGYISEEYHQECCKKYKPQKNDVYIIKSGSTTGKVAIVKTEQVFNIWSPLAVLRAKQDIVPDYLFYAVQSSYYQEQIIQAWGMGTQQNIGMRTLEHLKVAYPEYDEQNAIATALSDMDALIEAKKALLEKKRAIKQGAMQELLTGRRRLPGFPVTPMKKTDIGEIPEDWDEVNIKAVCNIDPDSLSSNTSPDFEFSYISLEGVSKGKLLNYEQKVFKFAPSRARKRPKEGDTLFGTVRPNLQSHYLFAKHAGEFVCSTGFAVLRPVRICPNFLFQLVLSNLVSVQIDSMISGSNYPAVSSSDVGNLIIPYPKEEEQQAIASVLNDMDAEINDLDEEIIKLRNLKQGMMSELLTGRIRLV